MELSSRRLRKRSSGSCPLQSFRSSISADASRESCISAPIVFAEKGRFFFLAGAGWSFQMELSVEASAETELRKLPRAELPELYFRRCLKGKLHFSSTGVVQMARLELKRSCKIELSPEASAETELRKLPRAELPELYFRRCLKGKLHFSSRG